MIGLWTLVWWAGCAGTSEANDDELHEEVIVGTWRVVPEAGELRNLKVIDAALSGQPDRKKALGDLTGDEEALFDEWSAKRGIPVENKKAELRFLEGAQLEFTEDQVTVSFGTDKYGPADYAVMNATADSLQLRFDPGLGNGLETHDIEWKGKDAGVDHITSSRRGAFAPLKIERR